MRGAQDKAGRHVNCDDLLGGSDCRCLWPEVEEKQAVNFLPLHSAKFLQLSDHCSVLLSLHSASTAHKEENSGMKFKEFRKQQKANLQLFNCMRCVVHRARAELCALLYHQVTHRSEVHADAVIFSVLASNRPGHACRCRRRRRSRSGDACNATGSTGAYVQLFWSSFIMVNSP